MLQYVYNQRIDSRSPEMVARELERVVQYLNERGEIVDCYNLNPMTRGTMLLTIIYHEKDADVLYVCDKKRCTDCHPQFCNHTHDISHAKNFSKLGSTDNYIEIEKE